MTIERTEALTSLKPNAKWTLIGNKLIWADTEQSEPSEEEIQAEIVRLEYARNRKEEYPPMEDQLDYIFHNGVDKWKEDIIQPVKDKYPKL
jgi:hypothetical protein